MPKRKTDEETAMKENKERESNILRVMYVIFCVTCIWIAARIVYLQCNFIDSDPYLSFFRAKNTKDEVKPTRGAILSSDGRLLAISVPMYQVYMDCTVRKEEFSARDKHGKLIDKHGEEHEEEWRSSVADLAKGLYAIYGKSSEYWRATILNERNKGNKYLKIGGTIDHETLQKVKALPLFNQGGNKGGIIVKKRDTRQYPYGSLARRVIGYVKDNDKSNGNNAIGLEGKYNYILHGTDGYRWTKRSDKSQITNRDSSWVNAKDGYDIRTTIDIDLQDIADNAMRKYLKEETVIEGGCVVVMDVKTGAIRAMVNLVRDSTSGALNETYNYAIGRRGEPGSVFKTATLMSVMEDYRVKLSDELATNGGNLPYFEGKNGDSHIRDYERTTHKKTMSVLHGYEISSNYIFRKLAMDHYTDNPKKFIDNLYMYKLGESYDFDLNGFASPYIPSPENRSEWSGTTLGSMAIGYSVSVTPLHTLTFYNAIANKGKMMKPYLVEDIEENGIVKEKKGPSVLNGSICSKATADSITAGLMKIAKEGTASKMKGAPLTFAGKTGTSHIVFSAGKGKKASYKSGPDQARKYQASIVGFFPAENPVYSAIAVIYTHPTRRSVYGGNIPARILREINEYLYTADSRWGKLIEKEGDMPVMSMDTPRTAKNGKVPNLKGLGLMDAIYAIENDGYRCLYSGIGHVVSQSPAAGSTLAAGEKITIRLE